MPSTAGAQRPFAAVDAALLDALPASVALLDRDGVIVAVNAAWKRFGNVRGWRCADDGVGADYPALCDATTGDAAENAARAARGLRAVLSGELADFSLEYDPPSFTTKQWVRMTVTPLRIDGAAGAVVMHVDISELKNAEEAMRESSSLLQAVLDGSPDVIFVKDLQSRYLLCNPAGARFSGHPIDEMVGHRVQSLYGHDDAAVILEGDRRILESGVPQTDEEVLHGAGETRTVLTTKAPYRNASGEMIGIIGIVRDITDRRKAEREREHEHQLLRTLIDSLPDAIYTKDVDGRFVISNRAAQALFGIEREEELAGKTSADLLPREAAERIRASDAEVLAGAAIVDREEVFVSIDGRSRWQLTTKMPLRDAEGVITGFVGIRRDITVLRHQQEALRDLNVELERRVEMRTADLNRARDEAEQANRAKSAFLATMSHEIRTPMNGVIGMLDVLHRTSLKGFQVEMVDLIRESAFSLLRIIDDVLDFSKIEAGELHTEAEPMQLADTVESVCAMLDPMAKERGVGVSVFVDPAIPHTVSGDAMRLRQVLVNLASNAIKFSSGREVAGRVSVRALLVLRKGDAAMVGIEVADNGIGMDDATLARLFTPFSQADISTTRRFGGSGLGLSISQMLVRVMGGSISVKSSTGHGSTFTVLLPFAVAPDGGAGPVVPAEPPLDCRIVGVEQPLAADLTAYLEHAGHRVAHSIDLRAASEVPQPAGLWLWLILPDPAVPPSAALRLMAPHTPGADTRFIVFGRGSRRHPRVDGADVVRVDVDPLMRATLSKVLALAAGRKDIDDDARGESARSSLAPAAPSQDLILVAEDNETNQKVIRLQLQLLGYAAEVASNGRDALERWRRGRFTLLLTDLHMPEMDGNELSTAIRAEEAPGERLPIIALTANVLRDEGVRCRAAGMDSFLTKPVRLPQLKAAIDAWLGGEVADVEPRRDVRQRTVAPADLAVLAGLVGDDPAVIAEMLRAFRADARRASEALRASIAAGSTEDTAAAAHRLKAGARTIGAHRLGDLCEEIERAAEAGKHRATSGLLPPFMAELEAVEAFLDEAPVAPS